VKRNMPAPRHDLAADIHALAFERGMQFDRIVAQQFVRAGLDLTPAASLLKSRR